MMRDYNAVDALKLDKHVSHLFGVQINERYSMPLTLQIFAINQLFPKQFLLHM